MPNGGLIERLNLTVEYLNGMTKVSTTGLRLA